MKRFSRLLIGAVFVGAGVLHMVRPRPFEVIVPPGLPDPHALVIASGAAEIAGGVGTLIPKLRPAAGVGLAALLVAVFPANVYMATGPRKARLGAPRWALWLRLPLQPLLIWWVRWATR